MCRGRAPNPTRYWCVCVRPASTAQTLPPRGAPPLAAITMHDAVVTNGRLKPGESVLIQGASSGVGLMGLQIAWLMGANQVIGSSTNEARRSRLKDYGAAR